MFEFYKIMPYNNKNLFNLSLLIEVFNSVANEKKIDNNLST